MHTLGPGFRIISEDLGIFRVLVGYEESYYSFDALDSSWAGRWVLLKFRFFYLRRIFIWLKRSLNADEDHEVFRLQEVDQFKPGRLFLILGGCCPDPIWIF
jgi:hypothetical protein